MKLSFVEMLTVLLLSCTCVTAYSQSDSAVWPNQVKLSLPRLIDIVNPGVELSYERCYGKRWSSQIAVARMFMLYEPAHTYQTYSGWRLAAEQKYFFDQEVVKGINLNIFKKAKKGALERYYIATEMVFLNVRYKQDMEFYNDNDRWWETVAIDKTTMAGNLKIGLQYRQGRFVIDLCGGVGVKHKSVSYSGISGRDSKKVVFFSVEQLSNREGDYFTINLPVNLKMGYVF